MYAPSSLQLKTGSWLRGPAGWLAFGSLLLGLVLLLPRADAQTKDKSKSVGKAKSVPTLPGYKRQTIHGFTLLINDEVYKNNDDSKWKRKPIDVLELELGTIVRKLPDRTVKALQRLLIWIEWEDTSDPDLARGVVAKFYGGGGAFMLARGKHPLKGNNIEVISMKSLTREHQPGIKFERCVLLHEMAHAVHTQVFGRENPGIKGAHQAAMARKLYDKTKDVYGREITNPYVTTNHAEYFAELSCAYLDKLHYFPFTHEDLKKHDPVGYKVMEQTWGTRKTIDASIKVKKDRQALARLERAQNLVVANKKAEAIVLLEWLVEELPDARSAPSAKKLLEKLKSATPAPKK